MFQRKEQYKVSEEELSDVETGNLPNKGFKVVFIQIFKKLRRRLDEQSEKSEVFNKELETIKKNQKK